MRVDQVSEVLAIAVQPFRGDAGDVDQLVVVAVDEITLEVEHVGQPAGEAGAEVQPGAAQHHHRAAGHVFAAVVTRALDDRGGAGIAHREAFAGAAGREQLAAGGAVQAGVAEDRRVLRSEQAADGWLQHDAPAGHALADVVIGFATQVQVQAAGVERAEALAGAAGQAHVDGPRLHPGVAVGAGDAAGQARADAAVGVADAADKRAAHAAIDGLAQRLVQLRGQAVRRRLQRGRAAETGRMRGISRQQPRQVYVDILAGGAQVLFQQVGAADRLVQRAQAQQRQPFAHVLGHVAEEAFHPLRQALEVVAAQALVLRRHAGSAVVEVADAQVFAAQHDHRRGAEAEAVCAQQRGLDHVQAGLEATVGLQ